MLLLQNHFQEPVSEVKNMCFNKLLVYTNSELAPILRAVLDMYIMPLCHICTFYTQETLVLEMGVKVPAQWCITTVCALL